MTNVFGLNGRTWIALTGSKTGRAEKLSTGKVYKQAIKRVFAEKYHDERMAVYWGRQDDTIHVIASLRHYVHTSGAEDHA